MSFLLWVIFAKSIQLFSRISCCWFQCVRHQGFTPELLKIACNVAYSNTVRQAAKWFISRTQSANTGRYAFSSLLICFILCFRKMKMKTLHRASRRPCAARRWQGRHQTEHQVEFSCVSRDTTRFMLTLFKLFSTPKREFGLEMRSCLLAE